MAGDETYLIDQWLAQALASSSVITSACGTHIYEGKAPDTAPFPYLTWNVQSNTDVVGVGTHRILTDSLYLVKVTAQVDSFQHLAGLARAIDDALTLAEPVSVANGIIHGAVRQQQFRQIDTEYGRQVRSLGGIYRILVQAV